MTVAKPVYVLTGSDEILLSAARTGLVSDLVGAGDRSLIVAELSGDDYELRELVDAAQTPPFLTDRRVVVGRGVQRFAKAELPVLLAYLADPLPTTALVLEWGGTSRVPKDLADAVTRAGGESIGTGPGRRVGEWAAQQLTAAGLKLDRAATARIGDWLGDDAGRLPGLRTLLLSAYGEGARLGEAEVEPLLGEAGGVPPWELTDALDKGDISGALTALHRMLGAGRHPLQILATLHSHVSRMLRLDGTDVRGEAEAAVILGLKGSTFPARKALAQARHLGPDRIGEAVRLLSAADLGIKGEVEWPPELVLEVLVARLARLARAGR